MAETIAYRTGRYSAHDDITHIWEIIDEHGTAAELHVTTDRHEVANIETREDRRGEGLARALWAAAERHLGTVYHAPEPHRTPEGDAFARAVGGPTAEYPCDCHGCTYIEEDED